MEEWITFISYCIIFWISPNKLLIHSIPNWILSVVSMFLFKVLEISSGSTSTNSLCRKVSHLFFSRKSIWTCVGFLYFLKPLLLVGSYFMTFLSLEFLNFFPDRLCTFSQWFFKAITEWSGEWGRSSGLSNKY